MNINSNELMLINKMNARYGQANQPAPVPTVEEPVTKPEYRMNALEAKAHNNIMFQGVQTKMLSSAKKMLLPLAMLAMVGTSALNQSCTPIEINQTVDVAIDMNAVLETLNGMKDLLVQNNEQNEALLATLERLIAQVEAMKGSQDDFYAFAVEYMMNDSVTQTAILEALEKQGLTQEEINAKMDNIYALMGKGDYAAVLDEIKNILSGMDATLKAILAELQGLRDDLNNALAADSANDKANIEILEKIYLQMLEDGKMDAEYFEALIQGRKLSNEHLVKVISMLGDLQAAMEKNHAEFIKYLQNLDPASVDYSKFEAMFKQLGLDLAEVIDLSRKDQMGALNEIKNAIDGFNTNYVTNEAAEAAQLQKVIDLLNEIKELEANSPDYNAKLDELNEAIKNLKHECNHEIHVDCDCNGNGGSTNEGELYG